jgi:hypothetical protein
MKKIFTLLFAVGILGSVVAQSNHSPRGDYGGQNNQSSGYQKDDQHGYTERNNNRHDDFSFRMRDEQIARINNDYDARINAIKYRRGGWFFEKNRMIRKLENERQQEIRMVIARFSERNNYSYHHNDRDNGRRY